MNQIAASVSHIVIESSLESAVLWGVALAFLRWSKASSPRIRAVLFLLPLLIPVGLATVFHIIVPLVTSATPDSKPVADLVGGWLTPSVPAVLVFLAAGMLGIVASVIFLWRQWWGWYQTHSAWQRQQHERSPLRLRCATLLQALASRRGLTPPRFILVEGGSAGSLALGPSGYVLVPEALSTELDDEELTALLAHELAHIRRKDGLLDSMARGCRNLMLFNPLAHLALFRFQQEREQATDDLAVRLGTSRPALASCLLRAYRLRGSRGHALATGLLGCESDLEQRVRRMLSAAELTEPSQFAWLALGALAVGVTIILGALM